MSKIKNLSYKFGRVVLKHRFHLLIMLCVAYIISLYVQVSTYIDFALLILLILVVQAFISEGDRLVKPGFCLIGISALLLIFGLEAYAERIALLGILIISIDVFRELQLFIKEK